MLHQLLKKISEGKPVNFKRLQQMLPKNFDISSCFNVEMVGKERFKVQIVDESAFNALLLSSFPATSRRSAASHAFQSSHDVKCDSAFMLCMPNIDVNNALASVDDEINPLDVDIRCAYSLGESLSYNYQPANEAILIENQDCFFHWQRMLKHFDSFDSVKSIDVYFSAGKQVLNSKFESLWPLYQKVHCLFDYDLEGLKIYQALVKKHSDKFYFLVPEPCEPSMFALAPKRINNLLEAINLARSLQLTTLAACFEANKCFMEQEALLL